MTQKRLKLIQIDSNSYGHIEPEDLAEAQEGDVVGGFEVVAADEINCCHPQRNWRIEGRRSSVPPTMTGKCTVCGHEIEHKYDEKSDSQQLR